MYHHNVHNDSAQLVKHLDIILKFRHMLIRGLLKRLSPNYAIFSTFLIEMYNYIVHNGSTP